MLSLLFVINVIIKMISQKSKSKISTQKPKQQQQQVVSLRGKIYVICLNPYCPKPNQRCLSHLTLQSHSQQCNSHYFPSEIIMKNEWNNIENYPSDTLGQAIKRKYKGIINSNKQNNQLTKNKSFLSQYFHNFKQSIMKQLNSLQKDLNELYPDEQLIEHYNSVYNLNRIRQSLRMNNSAQYITNLINSNFQTIKYQSLIILNESYDSLTNQLQTTLIKLRSLLQNLSEKESLSQTLVPTLSTPSKKPIQYDLIKSHFISSAQIRFSKGQITFPKIKNLSSFLPWIYGQKAFDFGIHQIRISSVRYPLVRNAGFTVIEEPDQDTYPYMRYKSLFSKDQRGFKLTKGEHIQTIITNTTLLILRIELNATPKALIFDSEMKSVYQCPLKQNTKYKLGVYGSGWSVLLLGLT